MNKEFIPYEQALEIKELGFEEPCFGAYVKNELFIPETERPSIQSHSLHQCLAPLYSQAFRFFREKYGLYLSINVKDSIWYFETFSLNGYKTYEEAEQACLNKLIQIANDI